MEEHTIYDDDGKGFTKVFSGTDIEFANPIEYYKNREVQRSMSLEKATLNLKNPIITASLSDEYFLKRANEKWEERLAQINANSVPENFILLLNAQSKHEQEKLLRGQSITPMQLAAYLFRAWTDFGYSFSNYRAEHHHKGVDEQDLPQLIHLDGENVLKAGATPLTDGQLKNVVNHRKVIVSKILEYVWEFYLAILFMRMEIKPIRNMASELSMVFSTSRNNRRLKLSQPKLRSTGQRFFSGTKP